MKTYCVLLCVSLVFLSLLSASCATAENEPEIPESEQIKEPFNHDAFDTLLKAHVDEHGKVDYQGFKENRKALKGYLNQLAKAEPERFSSRDERFAFWINAYNACTIEGVLNALPESPEKWSEFSIKKVKGFWTDTNYLVAGEGITLNDIEHKILRPFFKDPRVHFAIVCASGGCPELDNRAFSGHTLQSRLEARSKAFINDEKKCQFNATKKTMAISKIFKWFRSDFTKHGTLETFLADYVNDETLSEQLKKQKFSIRYKSYDWTLNLKDRTREK